MALSTINYTGTTGVLTSGTAVASTSGTSIDFTGIPSWVKRITVMFNGVSLSSTASMLVQLGVSGTPTTTGYVSSCAYNAGVGGNGVLTSTSGFVFQVGDPGYVISGSLVITNVSGNIWVSNGVIGNVATTSYGATSGGTVTLSGTLNMVRITNTSTNTFDAGSINILYE